eukprot:5229533-Pleurochrysis_carterae.AAC.2
MLRATAGLPRIAEPVPSPLVRVQAMRRVDSLWDVKPTDNTRCTPACLRALPRLKRFHRVEVTYIANDPTTVWQCLSSVLLSLRRVFARPWMSYFDPLTNLLQPGVMVQAPFTRSRRACDQLDSFPFAGHDDRSVPSSRQEIRRL